MKLRSGTRAARLLRATFWMLDLGFESMAKRMGITSGFICSTCSSTFFRVAPKVEGGSEMRMRMRVRLRL